MAENGNHQEHTNLPNIKNEANQKESQKELNHTVNLRSKEGILEEIKYCYNKTCAKEHYGVANSLLTLAARINNLLIEQVLHGEMDNMTAEEAEAYLDKEAKDLKLEDILGNRDN